METLPNDAENEAGPDLQADLALLTSVVRKAGALALSYFGAAPKSKRKADGTEVSEADLAVDDLLRETLTDARPAYGWLSEETEDDRARLALSHVWIVDPIDGTRAFLKERPDWTISAALVANGTPVIGAVFNPVQDELFLARQGAGATLNDTPLEVSDPGRIDGSRLLASKGLFRHDIWPSSWPEVEQMWVNSVAYRLAHVAAGRADATLSLSKKSDWDLAAAHLLVQEAGGVVTTHRGDPLVYNRPETLQESVIAAGPVLHEALLEQTRRARR